MVSGWCDGCRSLDPFTKECLDQENILVKEMELYIKAHDIKPLMELVMKAIDNIHKGDKDGHQ